MGLHHTPIDTCALNRNLLCFGNIRDGSFSRSYEDIRGTLIRLATRYVCVLKIQINTFVSTDYILEDASDGAP